MKILLALVITVSLYIVSTLSFIVLCGDIDNGPCTCLLIFTLGFLSCAVGTDIL
jgi:hypothetical protein